MASDDADKHVFISYVRDDKDRVDALCRVLNTVGIPYWLDREALAPGEAWKQRIRDAIQSGALAFVACFSTNSAARGRSTMNEELTVAVEEFRLRPPGTTWLIPVRLDNVDLPVWDLGAGRMLGDLNYVDLFGDDYANNLVALVAAIQRVIGHADAASTAAAAAQVDDAERPERFRSLTKQWVREPAHEIELDDLVAAETTRVIEAVRELGFGDGAGGVQTWGVAAINAATKIAEEIEPLCRSLQIGARWSNNPSLDPWTTSLTRLTNSALRIEAGYPVFLGLRQLPSLHLTFAGALAATHGRRWDNLKALVVDTTVVDPHRGEQPLLEVVWPWGPFNSEEALPQLLADLVNSGDTPEVVVDRSTGRAKKFTPVANWLFAILRPMFAEQLPDDEEYARAFDRTEIVLGVVSQDLADTAAAATGRGSLGSRWFGRTTWSSRYDRVSPVETIAQELQAQGSDWPPLRVGLFGGSVARAKAAIERYSGSFAEAARRRY